MTHPISSDSTTDLTPDFLSGRLFADPTERAQEASASLRFVRLCGRAFLFPRDAPLVSDLGATLTPDEWRQVVHIAANEGMLPLVFQQTTQAGLLQSSAAEFASALADGYRQTLVTNRALLGDLQVLLAAFDASQIPVIPLKGLSVAARYYGENALRPTSDIDLLARRADVGRSDRLLRSLGYTPLSGRASPWNFAALLHADLNYASPKGSKIELHWELTHRPTYRAGLAAGPIWSRARMAAIAGRPALCLSVKDELRFLCVHCSAGHQAALNPLRLIWLLDIARIVSTLPSQWDWPAFIAETIALRLATPVYLALSHASAYFNLDLPPERLADLRDACATREERDAWRFAGGSVFTPEGIQTHLRATDSVLERLAFARGMLAPSPAWIRQRFLQSEMLHRPLWRLYARYYSRLFRRLPELLIARRRQPPLPTSSPGDRSPPSA